MRFLSTLPRVQRITATAALLTLLALVATFGLDPFRNYQLAVAATTFCATAGLTLVVGLTGQLSLGHAVLMAAGGYGYALVVSPLADEGLAGVPLFVAGMIGAVAISGVVGLLLGLAAARLRGPYLAGLTLALVIALPAITSQVGALGGDQGLRIPFSGVPDPLQSLMVVEQWQAWVAIIVTAVAVTPLAVMRTGRAGLRMRAVHGDEVAARLAGVPAGRVKVGAFTASAVSAGLGGGVLCYVTQAVSPGGYSLAFSLLLVVAVVVGGLGSIGGAAVGAVLVTLLPWLVDTVTTSLNVSSGLEQRLSGNFAVGVFGALLIAVTLAWPGGLAGAFATWRRNRRRLDPRSLEDTITER